jgi:hypothetical protein
VKFIIRRYFPGYCTYEIDAEKAYDLAKSLPLDGEELLSTMQEWPESDEIELGKLSEIR